MTQKRKVGALCATEERRAKVAQLLTGDRRMTLAAVAAEVGCAVSTVHGDYQSLLQEWREGAGDRVALEVARQSARLDDIEARLWADFTATTELSWNTGNDPMPRDKACGLLLKTMERRARLMGMDSQKDVNLSHGDVNITVGYEKPDMSLLTNEELKEAIRLENKALGKGSGA